MNELKLAACVLFLATGCAQLLTSISRPGRLPSAVMLLSFGVALVLTIDRPYLALDEALGVANAAELISHLAGLVGIGVMTSLLLDVDGRSQQARRAELGALALVLLGSTVLFAASDVPLETPAILARYGDQWTVVGFWAVASVYALVCLVRLARTVSRSTPLGTRRDVVHGMRVAAVGGGVFGAVYIALKATELGSQRTGHQISGIHAWQQAALAPGMACLAVGLGLPLGARMLNDARRQLLVRRALVRLRARRRELVKRDLIVDAGPGLSSGSSVVADLLGGNADARLLRRVVEIRDALLLGGAPMTRQVRTDEVGLSTGLDLLGEAGRLVGPQAPAQRSTRVAT